jgi:3-hydroxyisobutyrate dehydrogenase-like beta-hydroxyacid dehydrogenase
MAADQAKAKIGWLGTGRMGFDMASRLLKGGCDVSVWNRTRAKAEPLAALGAKVVDSPSDLAGCDIVFSMLSTWNDVKGVVLGDKGLVSAAGRAGARLPRLVVECTSISYEGSAELRQALAERGVELLAAPVSGNAKVVKAGKLSFVVSGPRKAFDEAARYMQMMGQEASYVGEGDVARFVKICHNVFLGVVIQSLAEITVLAEKAGVPRHAFLDFLNKSVMGSVFSRYKSPALVNLDFHVTFTPYLLRKDLDLGLEAARRHEVPMPLASLTREMVQSMMGNGYADLDFSALILQQAKASGVELKPENVPVDDGLGAR